MRIQAPAKSEHDAFLVTDGSGREQDGWWGAAATVAIPSHGVLTTHQMGGAGMRETVERAEFHALLMGLEVVRKAFDDSFETAKRRVWWVSDRESLVLAVGRDHTKEGRPPFYRRKSTPDLWGAFLYYESIMDITPVFSRVEDSIWLQVVDIRSTEIREMFRCASTDWMAQDLEDQEGLKAAWRNPAWMEKCVQECGAVFPDGGPGFSEQVDILYAQYGRPAVGLAREVLRHRANGGADPNGPLLP